MTGKRTFYLVMTVALMTMAACGGMSKRQQSVAQDSVRLAKINLHDTTSYYLNGIDKCRIYADVAIEYPELYQDNEKTEALRELFLEVVLDIQGDSIPFEKALNLYVENLLNQYRDNNASIGESTEVDFEPVYDYNSSIKVTVPFNRNGIVNFCKTETTQKNNKVTMTRHYYYTIDLKTMTRIDLGNLFNDEAIASISEMLKAKLMRQLHAKNEDDLNDMGYYNLDNLVANNNFYMTSTGITWNYMPREVSVLDEVKISLDYDSISQYIPEQSILLPFIKK